MDENDRRVKKSRKPEGYEDALLDSLSEEEEEQK
jgi:hypothetical protein